MTSTELALPNQLDDAKVDLIKRTIAKGASNDELELFIHICNRTQLDPFMKQIYLVPRWDKNVGRNVYQVQASIDAARLTAQRSHEYAGQTPIYWCGEDGIWTEVWLKKTHPVAAKVGVYRAGFSEPLWAVANWDTYAQLDKNGNLKDFWKRGGPLMLGKCFSEDTEVLTDRGFVRFSEVPEGSRIMQVTDHGLEPVEAIPFRQYYPGPMVAWESDDLNFVVTPNHDMVTTVGKVEASAMYETSHSRGPWLIPRKVPTSEKEMEISDNEIRLCAWIAADGWKRNSQWGIAVGKHRKIEAIRSLNLSIEEGIRHVRDKEAVSRTGRVLRSNFDQVVFRFNREDTPLIVGEKLFDLNAVSHLSSRQAKLLVDTMIEADGSTNRATGVRRFYSSRLNHLEAFEIAAIQAGYAVSARKSRMSE